MGRQSSFYLVVLVELLLPFGLGMGGSVCFAHPDDRIRSNTRLGSGVFVQSLEMAQHFKKQDHLDSNFFVKKREEQEDPRQGYQFEEASPLSWNLGVAYSNINSSLTPSTPTSNNTLLTGVVGLKWKVNSAFETSALVDIDSIPQEDYRHGAAVIQFSFTLALKKLSNGQARQIASIQDANDEDLQDSESDAQDASLYYKKLREMRLKNLEKMEKRARELRSPASEVLASREAEEDAVLYPYFKFTYSLGFHTHLRNGESDTQQTLNQYQHGPEMIYSPVKKWKFLAAFHYCYYSANVTSFLGNLGIGQSQRVGLAAVGGWSPFVNQILTLPAYTLDAGAEWDFSEKEKISFYLNQTSYQAATQASTFTISPTYFRDLGEKWRVGVGASAILGVPNSTLFSGSADVLFKL